MTRLGAVFWLGLVVASGFTTFKVKYAVQEIEDELMRVRKQTVAEQQEIRVLTAEWTYLNQPERLADLNRRFLQLAPVGTRQLQAHIEDFPLRPPPAPPAPEPDVLVAAAPAAPAEDTLASLLAQVTAVEPATPAAAPAPEIATASAVAAAAMPTVAAAAEPPARNPAAVAASLLGMSAQAAPVHLVKAAPASLDALIQQIAETR